MVHAAVPRRADDRRGVDLLAAGLAARPTSAASASTSSGTWAGCTTPCATWRNEPDLPPLPPRPAHLQHALRLHRELRPAALARRGGARQGLAARPRCPATSGSASPTCARSTPTCAPTRARSCCSWAASSASGTSGTSTRCSTGTCSNYPLHQGLQHLVRDLNRALPRARPRCTSWISTGRASNGSTATTRQQSRALLPAQGRRRRVRGRRGSTSPRCRATATASACPGRAATAKCSTPTRQIYGGSNVGNGDRSLEADDAAPG